MKKIIFLIAIALFSLNCAPSAGNNAATTNKTNTTNTTANKPATPASTPATTADGKSNPELDFTLVNKTGYDIKAVSVGPTGDAEWKPEDEILKGRTLANGSSLDVKFHPRLTGTNWDLMVEWSDGTGTEEWIKLDLTEIEKVTLKYDKATDTTSADIE